MTPRVLESTRLPALRQLTRAEAKAAGRKTPLWLLEPGVVYRRQVAVFGGHLVEARGPFYTDGASTRWYTKWIVSRWGHHSGAVLLHDATNAGRLYFAGSGTPVDPTFGQWNAMFVEIARRDGTPGWKLELMRRAIEGDGGRSAWKSGEPARQAQVAAWERV